MHLRGYGWVTVFKFVAKNGRIDYVTTNMENPTRDQVRRVMDACWSIEVYHRELKQTCGIERCQARTGRAQRNHIFMAIAAWLDKHRRRLYEKITLYEQDWRVIKSGITQNNHAFSGLLNAKCETPVFIQSSWDIPIAAVAYGLRTSPNVATLSLVPMESPAAA